MKALDLIGHTFGELTVIGKLLERDSQKRVVWECRCSCGTSTYVPTLHLRSGHTTSCGCKKVRDLTGQRFGRLLVLGATDKRCSGAVKWKVRCDCGVEKVIARGPLVKGETVSCGCYFKDVITTHGLSKTRAYRTYYQNLREHAKLERTPKWADIEAIKQIYQECPEGYEVDHIVPLKARLASGLHTPENLQYLPASENRKKYNKFTPQVFSSN